MTTVLTDKRHKLKTRIWKEGEKPSAQVRVPHIQSKHRKHQKRHDVKVIANSTVSVSDVRRGQGMQTAGYALIDF